MSGGAGNDIYYVDSSGDSTLEEAGAGTDTVYTAAATCWLANNVENGIVSGSAGVTLFGNGLDNVLTGGAGADSLVGSDGNDTVRGGGGNDWIAGDLGNDTLTGGRGADEMRGGPGDDVYYVDSSDDIASEGNPEDGTDTVYSTISYTLGYLFENGVLTGTAHLSLSGNELENELTGNSGNNALDGGAGNDTLTGRAGSDTFQFDEALSDTTNVDRIVDFSVPADSIVLDQSIFTALSLGELSADAFVTGTSAQSADDRIIYDSATGRIYYDADGNGAGAQVLFAQVTASLALTNADFLVVG